MPSNKINLRSFLSPSSTSSFVRNLVADNRGAFSTLLSAAVGLLDELVVLFDDVDLRCVLLVDSDIFCCCQARRSAIRIGRLT
jgi:hypothetical protein